MELVSKMEFIQLTWSNWSNVCEFVSKENFIIGVFLDDDTKLPIENDKHTSNTIGLLLKLNNRKILVKQDDYIIKENDTIKIMNQIQFDILVFNKKIYRINNVQKKTKRRTKEEQYRDFN